MNTAAWLLPSYRNILASLETIIEKAQTERGADGKTPGSILDLRLSEDMLPLSNQIQFVCLQIEEVSSRCADHPIETIKQPSTLAEAVALISQVSLRLEAAIDIVKTRYDGSRVIELHLPGLPIIDFTLDEYLRSWAIPQVHFHLVTAYAILRHHGIGLGKADYVPHVFTFMRKP